MVEDGADQLFRRVQELMPALPKAMSGGTPRKPEWNKLIWGKKLL
jgi:hypothetical protein